MAELTEYEALRKIVVAVRLRGEEDARTCAAMLSRIDKAEQAGEPCPGYVGMLEDIKATEAREPATLAELERRFPVISWREPIAITVSGNTVYGCRICISRDGLRAEDVIAGATGFATRPEAAEHIQREHIEKEVLT